MEYLRLLPERTVPLGGVRGIEVHRTLPQRDLPTIGLWCFIDRFGPSTEEMRVLPHPHTGLQTVTWIQQGAIRHRDSLGSDLVVRPGHLDLMTGGRGVSHSEFPVPASDRTQASPDAGLTSEQSEPLQGVQLWTVLPEAHRHDEPQFQSLTTLPVVRGDGFVATVMVGSFLGERSPATVYGPMVGVSLTLDAGTTARLPLDVAFEYGLLVTDGAVVVLDPDESAAGSGTALAVGPLAYLAPGHEDLVLTTVSGTTVLLLGGEPFTEDIVMWWNFIGRSHQEIVEMREDWESARNAEQRYGVVAGHHGRRIPAPPMPSVTLRPRTRRAMGGAAAR